MFSADEKAEKAEKAYFYLTEIGYWNITPRKYVSMHSRESKI